MLNIYVDADACPVKTEVYRVAERYSLKVVLVANTWMRVAEYGFITLEIVGDAIDEVDDWIVEHVKNDDIVITSDILLASRCLKKQSYVILMTGKAITEDNISGMLASRNLMESLRESGEITGGPAPFQKSDRSRFLQELDKTIQLIRRKY